MCSSPSGGLFHAALEGFFFSDARFGGVFADVFGELHRASAFAQGRVAQICRAGFRACRLRSFPTSRTKADGLTRNPGTGKSPEPADRNVCPTSKAEIDLGNTPQGYGGHHPSLGTSKRRFRAKDGARYRT